jgi:hypothetical protein
MNRILISVSCAAAIVAAAAFFLLDDQLSLAQGRDIRPPAVDLAIANSFRVPAADEKTQSIVKSANTFLSRLSASQRDAAVFPFDDNLQRSNWSNLPHGIVQRRGVMLGDLSEEQRASLDALLAEFMSEEGVRNIVYQLLGEDSLGDGNGRVSFGSEYFFAAFLGEPSASDPWMFQFGGHHLAINATVFGPEVSFAPMLTGGQPLHVRYRGNDVYTTQRETAAAQAFMDSLSQAQEDRAVRGNRAINLLLGPGKDGTVIAPEGIKGSDLTTEQKALLLDVIRARLGFINENDFMAKFATIAAEIDETYFGWWGAQHTLGAAYFRVTGPSLTLEYAPQGLGGDTTDHAHNMYREPGNDYGKAWIGAQ